MTNALHIMHEQLGLSRFCVQDDIRYLAFAASLDKLLLKYPGSVCVAEIKAGGEKRNCLRIKDREIESATDQWLIDVLQRSLPPHWEARREDGIIIIGCWT